MKIEQPECFEPITITLETLPEAEAFWGIMRFIISNATKDTCVDNSRPLAMLISDIFSNGLKL